MFLLHFCIKKDQFNINRWLYCINVTKKSVTCQYWLVILMHKCNKKISHLLILNGQFLMHKCNKKVGHLLRWLKFLLHLSSKNDHSILTGDWFFCYIYALKWPFNNDRWLTFLFVNIEWSFLMQKCNQNVSHLITLSGHSYCINVTKTSVTC
jgi:hypothetical protein